MAKRQSIRLEAVKQCVDEGHYGWTKDIGPLQVAVYVMVGGGMLGRSAAEQPADFYIDGRVGSLPYPKGDIKQAVAVLVAQAEAMGLDPRHLPEVPAFHACGIW